MRLTSFSDYNLRVLMYLALHPDELVTIQQIAAAYDISVNNLMKVVQHLAKQGDVTALRGKGGGLRLGRPAGEIGVGEVVRRMEPGFELVDCFRAESSCLLNSNCRLKGALHAALQAFLATLDELTLADLIVDQPQLRDQLGIVELIPVA